MNFLQIIPVKNDKKGRENEIYKNHITITKRLLTQPFFVYKLQFIGVGDAFGHNHKQKGILYNYRMAKDKTCV